MPRTHKLNTITEFSRHPAEHIDRLTASKQPELYSHNDKPCVVIQDVESYERMAELVDYAESRITLRRALSEQGRPLQSFTQEFEASAGITS
jgi:PHD/YefM family antitoxin component YafN of YafNO toxin-antitoxin module